MSAPYLHALSCSKCGAALTLAPGQQVLTCEYCRQAHVFVPPPPREPPGTVYAPGERVAVSQPPKAQAPAPAHTYAAGDSVEIELNGYWYPGRILEVAEPRYKVTYEGHASTWEEWVGASRLRRPP